MRKIDKWLPIISGILRILIKIFKKDENSKNQKQA